MLHVYSEKLQKILGFDVTETGKLAPVGAASLSDSNIMFSWNNSADSWVDNGWNNSADRWIDNGWNNSSSSWQNQGWSNSSGNWLDQGWSNSADSWGDSGGNGGGCFITTACVEQKGLADDCREMQVLRHHRDILVEKDENFRSKVLEYYRKAPLIIHEIDSKENSGKIYDDLYDEMIKPCVDLLEEGKTEEAKSLYIDYYERLSKEYLTV